MGLRGSFDQSPGCGDMHPEFAADYFFCHNRPDTLWGFDVVRLVAIQSQRCFVALQKNGSTCTAGLGPHHLLRFQVMELMPTRHADFSGIGLSRWVLPSCLVPVYFDLAGWGCTSTLGSTACTCRVYNTAARALKEK